MDGGPGRARIRGVIDDRATERGFRPAVRVTGPLHELTSDVLTDVLAVLGEALTNVARHARAGSVDVEVAVTGDGVTLWARDDGIGLAAAPRDGGLADLRRRAAWHGGSLSVQPEPGGGTRLTWAVPGGRARPSHGRTADGRIWSGRGGPPATWGVTSDGARRISPRSPAC